MGFAQVFQYLLLKAGFAFKGFNTSGVIYWILNVPAIIVAIKRMRRRFVLKTIFAITSITILLSVIPIVNAPIMDDRITNTIIAGILCGSGIGIILWMGGCDGGMNIVGMLYISSTGKGSVGTVSMAVNLLLYAVMLFLFDAPTVIYTLIYSVFSSMATDKIHTQNISSQVTIITKLEDTKELEVEVMGRLHRGMTRVNGNGIFTGDDVKMFIIFISKYEYSRLKGIVKAHDPNAFIVVNEGVHIDGHFLKKLT
jgi:uncharacterized membrane-anchored protein YitT (DUF2179 family)